MLLLLLLWLQWLQLLLRLLLLRRLRRLGLRKPVLVFLHVPSRLLVWLRLLRALGYFSFVV